MSAYYNEIDPQAAAWLRQLIGAKVIPDGEVDERSIEDIHPSDLRGFVQCHFFAGIGGWPEGLRIAGWPDDRAVWTGSCPCQSFSAAGTRTGFADKRHLWPAWFHLIEQCRPPVVFGEQVDAAVKFGWLDLVQADMEAAGYAIGRAVIPAAGVGAPHGRHRLWFVADANRGAGGQGRALDGGRDQGSHAEPRPRSGRSDLSGELAYPQSHGRQGQLLRAPGGLPADGTAQDGDAGGLAHASGERRDWQPSRIWRAGSSGRHATNHAEADGHSTTGGMEQPESEQARISRLARERRKTGGFWSGADWIYCRDDKWRPVEPGTFPLAHGIPARVGRLRGYGNALVPQVAAHMIEAFSQSRGEK